MNRNGSSLSDTLQWRSWPLGAWVVAALAVYVLVLSAIGNITTDLHQGQVLPGVITFRTGDSDCLWVNPLTPPSWRMVAEDLVRPFDCIVTVDGIPARDWEAVDRRMAERLEGALDQRFLALQVERSGNVFNVVAPVTLYTLGLKLQMQLVLDIAGLLLWIMGVLVFVTQPRAEANRVLAGFLLVASLLIMGSFETFEGFPSQVYNVLAIHGGRSFLGALLFNLALIFPLPVGNVRLLPLRFVLYPIAVFSLGLHVVDHFEVFAAANPDLYRRLVAFNLSLVLLLLATGVLAWFGRLLWVAARAPAPHIRSQARWLLAAWFIGIPVAFIEFAGRFGLSFWPLARTSDLTFVFWVVPMAALIAYTMLRYQAFAYRGAALNVLVVIFASATLTQVYGFFTATRGWDGVQFAVVWGATLLTTLFWYVESPLRRGFRRLFVRHEYDYQIANRFSGRLAAAKGVDQALAYGARALCDGLEVEWAATASLHRTKRIWLAEAGRDAPSSLMRVGGGAPAELPSLPVLTQAITDGANQIGTLWLGPRTTAEPLDEQDARLVALLGQELARALAVHAHIEDLERVPGRILAAVEADRGRIGQDLHDSVLQFLGAIPLELQRAGRLVASDPGRAVTVLNRTIDQAELVALEARSAVYDLSPPLLLRQGVVEAGRAYSAQAAAAEGVQVQCLAAGDGWDRLDETRSTHVDRILQQAVDNALAHAAAANLTLRFDEDDGEMMLRIEDDGTGFDPAQAGTEVASKAGAGLGLVSMQARARALDGSVKVTSALAAGTTVILRFPAGQDGHGRK